MKEKTLALIEHYKRSKEEADLGQSKLIKEILLIDGMTSSKTRHFYNNILEYTISDRNTQYLEIGSWKGSSLVSALYKNNHVDSICIDNWSEFGGPREEFMSNCSRFISPDQKLTVIESDCFSNKLDQKFDIYLYDGEHSYEAQVNAITYFENNLADSCLIIIDDWNNEERVQKGTLDGLSKIDFEIKFSEEILSRHNGDLDGYWNGMAVFVLEKNNS